MDSQTEPEVLRTDAPTDVLIWDLPTRIFHWTLAVAFLIAAVTSEDQWLKLHVLAGYVIAGLLVFRLLWGFIGGRYSRFAQFAFPFQSVREHLAGLLAGRHKLYLSHNPAGSWSVLIMLGGSAIVVFGGILLLGGEEQHGIARSLSLAAGEIAYWLHFIAGNLLIGFVFVHIAGVVVDSKLSDVNLIASMVHGYKKAPPGSPGVKRAAIASVFMVLFVTALVGGLFELNGNESFNPLTSFAGRSLQTSSEWQAACSDCHMAWHPSLLPSRSWKKLFARQHQHFGEDLFLEPGETEKLLAYATANSADLGPTEAARKINASIDPAAAPIRITETPYWKHKHDEIDSTVWQRKSVGGRSNCGACHSDAAGNLFDDNAMRIPN